MALISQYVQIRDDAKPRKTYKIDVMPWSPAHPQSEVRYKLVGVNGTFLESELIFINSSDLVLFEED